MLTLAIYTVASKATRWLAERADVPTDAWVQFYDGTWRMNCESVCYADGGVMLCEARVRRGHVFTVATELPPDNDVQPSVYVLLSAREL